MKKIILIGTLNDTIKELNDQLSGRYHVQLCSENYAAFIGMMDIVAPDLVLASLVGAGDPTAAIFRKLAADYPAVPVLTVGTEQDRDAYRGFYDGGHFTHLLLPASPEAVYEAVRERIGAGDPVAARKKVLVVDDDPMLLRGVKLMLDEVYEVSLANSGMQAIAAIGRSRPDLILLDYEMPVCDGKQTLEMIRADAGSASIPVVFLTGVNDREHIEAVVRLQPAGYLLKPPVKETLLARAAEILGA